MCSNQLNMHNMPLKDVDLLFTGLEKPIFVNGPNK